MKRSGLLAFRCTGALHGGADNPYVGWARGGAPSKHGSLWIAETDIRHPADDKWGPTRYGGNEIPTMGEFIASFNDAHPVIEPLYHPKLTHKQKITRLYKRSLRELYGKLERIPECHGLAGYYCRQIRAEFEKHRDADPGTAEWYFVRAINHIEHSKQEIYYGPEWYIGRTSYGRYSRVHNPEEFNTFPHGFDPTEAYKLENPYHKFGIPFFGGRIIAAIHPHAFMMKPSTTSKMIMTRRFFFTLFYSIYAFGTLLALTYISTGNLAPGVEKSITPERTIPSIRNH